MFRDKKLIFVTTHSPILSYNCRSRDESFIRGSWAGRGREARGGGAGVRTQWAPPAVLCANVCACGVADSGRDATTQTFQRI